VLIRPQVYTVRGVSPSRHSIACACSAGCIRNMSTALLCIIFFCIYPSPSTEAHCFAFLAIACPQTTIKSDLLETHALSRSIAVQLSCERATTELSIKSKLSKLNATGSAGWRASSKGPSANTSSRYSHFKHDNVLFYRRFAQRSAWLLLERADEPFTMVRTPLSRVTLRVCCVHLSQAACSLSSPCNFPPHHSLTNCIGRG
jgi:hypothetical protein